MTLRVKKLSEKLPHGVNLEEWDKTKTKAISTIILTLILIGILTVAFNIPPVKASGTSTELAYDDGTSEIGPAWNVAGGMFAVQFTAPFYPVKILEARIFFHALNNPSIAIRIHILDDAFNDLIAPIDLIAYQSEAQTWLSVDVSSSSIVLLSGDFFIASEQMVAGDPDIGSDTSSSPQGRSWEFNMVSWYPQLGTNYMIRALIEPCTPDLTVFDPEIDGRCVSINGVVLPGTSGTSITRIHWDWGDGNEEDHWFPGSHTYSCYGDYTVTVTAYQSDGLTSTETKQISLVSRWSRLLSWWWSFLKRFFPFPRGF